MNPAFLWSFLPRGYAFSVAVETPILLLGLSRGHSLSRKLFAGFWLTACTYPIVVLVLPLLIDTENHLMAYLMIAETFAPLAECLLFWAAFDRIASEKISTTRDMILITAANLASFGLGELVYAYT